MHETSLWLLWNLAVLKHPLYSPPAFLFRSLMRFEFILLAKHLTLARGTDLAFA